MATNRKERERTVDPIDILLAALQGGARYVVPFEGRQWIAMTFRGSYMIYLEDDPLSVKNIGENGMREALLALLVKKQKGLESNGD